MKRCLCLFLLPWLALGCSSSDSETVDDGGVDTDAQASSDQESDSEQDQGTPDSLSDSALDAIWEPDSEAEDGAVEADASVSDAPAEALPDAEQDGAIDGPEDTSLQEASADGPEEAAPEASIDTDAAALARHLNIDVFLIRSHSFCMTGPLCPSTQTDGCVEAHTDGAVTYRFIRDQLRVLSPLDPSIPAPPAAVFCMTSQIDDSNYNRIQGELSTWSQQVSAWTAGRLALDLRVHELGQIQSSMTPLGNGMWLAPWDLDSALRDLVSTDSDAIVVSTSNYDPVSRKAYDVPLCGGTLGADWGIRGAGFSWIPQTGNWHWFECSDHGVYGHEWLHQVEFALPNLSGFDDIYLDESTGARNYPACGQGNPNPHLWFPSTHDCLVDPDSPDCGHSDCSGNDAVNRHSLHEHYDPDQPLMMNHCRDGRQDYGETGVDIGGSHCGTSKAQPSMGKPLVPYRFTPVPTSGRKLLF